MKRDPQSTGVARIKSVCSSWIRREKDIKMVIIRIAQTHASTSQSSKTKEIRFGNRAKLKYHSLILLCHQTLATPSKARWQCSSPYPTCTLYSTCRIRTHVTSLICPNSVDLIQWFVCHAIKSIERTWKKNRSQIKTFTINDGISENRPQFANTKITELQRFRGFGKFIWQNLY